MKGNAKIVDITSMTINQVENELKTKTTKGWIVLAFTTINNKQVVVYSRDDAL